MNPDLQMKVEAPPVAEGTPPEAINSETTIPGMLESGDFTNYVPATQDVLSTQRWVTSDAGPPEAVAGETVTHQVIRCFSQDASAKDFFNRWTIHDEQLYRGNYCSEDGAGSSDALACSCCALIFGPAYAAWPSFCTSDMPSGPSDAASFLCSLLAWPCTWPYALLCCIPCWPQLCQQCCNNFDCCYSAALTEPLSCYITPAGVLQKDGRLLAWCDIAAVDEISQTHHASEVSVGPCCCICCHEPLSCWSISLPDMHSWSLRSRTTHALSSEGGRVRNYDFQFVFFTHEDLTLFRAMVQAALMGKLGGGAVDVDIPSPAGDGWILKPDVPSMGAMPFFWSKQKDELLIQADAQVSAANYGVVNYKKVAALLNKAFAPEVVEWRDVRDRALALNGGSQHDEAATPQDSSSSALGSGERAVVQSNLVTCTLS